jgi:hypothetical protein
VNAPSGSLQPKSAATGPAPAPTPPAPALEARSGQTLDPYRASQQQRLNSYGWVDRSAGIARIPIDRAIDLLTERGMPSRSASEAEQYRDHGDRSASDPSSGRLLESTGP